MAIKVNGHIKHNGNWYDPGDIILNESINKKEAQRLVKKGLGVEVVVDEQELDKNESIDSTDPGSSEEPLEETLALNFNTTELKEGATEQGLDFPGNISQKNIIKLIIITNYILNFTIEYYR